jgi:hypothetical protein
LVFFNASKTKQINACFFNFDELTPSQRGGINVSIYTLSASFHGNALGNKGSELLFVIFVMFYFVLFIIVVRKTSPSHSNGFVLKCQRLLSVKEKFLMGRMIGAI